MYVTAVLSPPESLLRVSVIKEDFLNTFKKIYLKKIARKIRLSVQKPGNLGSLFSAQSFLVRSSQHKN